MKYRSTRGDGRRLAFSDAALASLAPDGGLYVPERFPPFSPSGVDARASLANVGARFLAPFFEGDRLAPVLAEICRSAFNFETPLRRLDASTDILELFHGPTAAFKDVGARFLAQCLVRLDGSPRTVLVATSGDTGGAVAAAFHRKPGVDVVVLFPEGSVSPEQEMQLTTWGENVTAFAVRGTFDDCQRLVKEAFRDARFSKARGLISANSINLARLLPQTVYYAKAAIQSWRRDGEAPGIVVPSGNLGNAVACFWARACGVPIRHIALATNANPAISEFYRTGESRPAPTLRTLANAMDVGSPSNLERLVDLFPNRAELLAVSSAITASDDDIRRTLVGLRERHDVLFCPHTATALFARAGLPEGKWIVVATAHPGKFASVLEPLVGPVPLPAALEALREKPRRFQALLPELGALEDALGQPSA